MITKKIEQYEETVRNYEKENPIRTFIQLNRKIEYLEQYQDELKEVLESYFREEGIDYIIVTTLTILLYFQASTKLDDSTVELLNSLNRRYRIEFSEDMFIVEFDLLE